MADNTVFDSSFKTMVTKSPKLVVPFINEAFGRDYPLDEPFIKFSDDHESPHGSRVTDSIFKIRNKLYHVECQSTDESDMVVRMIEYDFSIALEGALKAGSPYEMTFPESCVLFLRHKNSTPDTLAMKVNLPDGGSFDYKCKVVKAQKYSREEIFGKGLLLLLPFYLMRYEDALADIAADDTRAAQLLAECAELRAELEAATLAQGEPLLYEQLLELIIRVSDHMLEAHEALQQKVRRAMGGEVLELMRERAERMEREARKEGLELGLEQGLEQGLEKGLEQGLEQGIEQGIDALADALAEQGLDKDVIAKAVGDLKAGARAE